MGSLSTAQPAETCLCFAFFFSASFRTRHDRCTGRKVPHSVWPEEGSPALRRLPCMIVARAHGPHSAKVCPVFFAFSLIFRGFTLDIFAVSRSVGRRSCSPGILVTFHACQGHAPALHYSWLHPFFHQFTHCSPASDWRRISVMRILL
jgi:hypothetical protein